MSRNDIKEQYNDYMIDSMILTVKRNANETDRRILNNHLALNKYKNFAFNNIEANIESFYSDYIKEQTFKPREMFVHITNDKGNSLVLESGFNISKFYLTPVNYSYLTKPGSILFKGNFLT